MSTLHEQTRAFQRRLIERTLAETSTHAEAARVLGLDRSHFCDIRKRLGIDAQPGLPFVRERSGPTQLELDAEGPVPEDWRERLGA